MNYTVKKQSDGFSLIELIVIAGLFGLIVLVGVLMLGNERAKTRDAQRLADMTRVQAAMQLLYFEKMSYAEAADGCKQAGDPVAACGLGRYLPGFGTLRDPGKFSYTVGEVPDIDSYRFEFTLERGYGTLAAGKHQLTKSGIQ